MLFSGKENVFICLVAFQKMFRKIFFDVWLCSWKYHRKHIFYLLLTFSRLPNKYIISFIPQYRNTNKTQKKKLSNPVTFSQLPNKYIISFIPQHRNTNKTQEKKIIKSGQIERRMKRERQLGSTRGCDQREGKIAIGAVLREIVIDAKARSRSMARSFSLCASVSHSFSLSFSLCATVSSSLCASQFRKWFEGKIKTKIILQDQRTHFTVNESYFPFDPIFRTNQTPTFPENHFRNQFEAKTNRALNNLLMT